MDLAFFVLFASSSAQLERKVILIEKRTDIKERKNDPAVACKCVHYACRTPAMGQGEQEEGQRRRSP